MGESRGIAMVRAGEKAHLFEECREGGFVTIGWFHTPARNMSLWTLGDLEDCMAEDYPVGSPHEHRDGSTSEWTAGKVTRDTNQIASFLFDMDPGRLVTVAAAGHESVLLGVVTSRYEFRHSSMLGRAKDPYHHFKLVRWLATLERPDMSEHLAAYMLNRRYQTVFWFDDESARELTEAL